MSYISTLRVPILFHQCRLSEKYFTNYVDGGESCRRAVYWSNPDWVGGNENDEIHFFPSADLRSFLRDTFGWQGVVRRSWPVANFPRPTGRSGEFRVIVARSLVAELKDSEDGTDGLSDFIYLAFILRVDRFEAVDHSLDFVNTGVQLLLLCLENSNQVINFVDGTLSLVAVTSLFQDGFIFGGRHEIQRLDTSHLRHEITVRELLIVFRALPCMNERIDLLSEAQS